MELIETKIQGCWELVPQIHRDCRGSFVKTFHSPTFESLGLETDFVEEYYSVSKEKVVRGMHFQVPPHQHSKLVYCTAGEVLDVILDLRIGSPTYGQYQKFTLSSAKGNMVYIPEGLAHGFFVLSQVATMHYKVTSTFEPASDRGVLWNSFDFDWPSSAVILSPRDSSFPSFHDFVSPFIFESVQ